MVYRLVTLLGCLLMVGCATGPRPIYTDLTASTGSSSYGTVIGRSVSSGPELVVLRDLKTNAVKTAIRSISLNREHEFVIALAPGTYAIHALGIHGAPIGARDKPFLFSVNAGEVVYVGTFVNEWHPPAPNEVSGVPVRSKPFGPMVCARLLCSGYLDVEIRAPYRNVTLVDESATLPGRLRAQVPDLAGANIVTRLAE